MPLIERYELAISAGDISDDPLQRKVVLDLQRLVDELVPRAWYHFSGKKLVKGLYLYGPVGVGKTYLLDMFYSYVKEKKKIRLHFHDFMRQIDADLRRLQGHEDPLYAIAAKFSKTTRLLCLDEFLVNDVAHAMILATLLQGLYEHGVVLVVTANTRPDDLYLNGVQRQRFLPAISLLKTHNEVILLTEERDYRLGRDNLPGVWFCPLNLATEAGIAQQFADIPQALSEDSEISVQNRKIPVVKVGNYAVWFQFDVICNLPRCQLDYLEISERFHTVFVSDVKVLTQKDTVAAILLIHFIDVMYDRGIRVVISAAVPARDLYCSGEMLTPFQRTLSRLEEMQSADYLQRHKGLDSKGCGNENDS